MTCIDIDDTRSNLFGDEVENPRQDHIITTDPGVILDTSIDRGLRKTSINECQFVLGNESHQHRSAPGIVVFTNERLRLKVKQ